MNLFETATRKKLRFDSGRGQLNVEQLWDVPLRSKDNVFDLNTLARLAKAKVKAAIDEENFVDSTKTAADREAELALDIIKHVIAVKLAEEAAAKKRAENRNEQKRLLELIAKKQDAALEGESLENLQKKLAALDAAEV